MAILFIVREYTKRVSEMEDSRGVTVAKEGFGGYIGAFSVSLLLALILALVVLLASVTVVLFFIGPVMLLQPRRRGPDFYRSLGQYVSPTEADLRFEEITIVTHDGLKLNSWLIKGTPDAPGTVIYL